MGTEAPTTVVIPVHCAPKKAPCPKCGKRGRRKRTLTRTVRTVAYKAGRLPGDHLRRVCRPLRLLHDLPQHPRGRRSPRPSTTTRSATWSSSASSSDGMSVERALESIRREFLLDLSTGFVYDVLRDRAARTRHGRAPPQGPGALQRHALRRRAAPGPVHPAAGHRPAGRPAGGLRPGRQERPGPHAAVPPEPQDLGPGPRGRGHRRLEPLPRRAGRAVARRGPPAVRLPRHQGHQQADPRRRAAAADGDGPAGQGRAEEEAGPQGGQVQGRAPPGGA